MIRNILDIKNDPASFCASWPSGTPFYLKNSQLPRYLLYCDSLYMWFIACPDLDELETLEDFILNPNYSFYYADEDYLGVRFDD